LSDMGSSHAEPRAEVDDGRWQKGAHAAPETTEAPRMKVRDPDRAGRYVVGAVGDRNILRYQGSADAVGEGTAEGWKQPMHKLAWLTEL